VEATTTTATLTITAVEVVEEVCRKDLPPVLSLESEGNVKERRMRRREGEGAVEEKRKTLR
jgi:hypothetical protein